MPLLLAKQCAAIGHGIEPTGARQFINESLYHERVVRVPHGAPRPHRHIDLRVVYLEAYWERIGALGQTLGHRRVDPVLDGKWLKRGAGHDGLADDHVLPRQHLALAVVADFDPMEGHLPVAAAAYLVFARPDHLHATPTACCDAR